MAGNLDPKTEAGSGSASDASEPVLPPMTAAEYRVYNRLSERMELFHDYFRQTWHMLYNAVKAGKRPSNMSLKQFIDEAINLAQYLTNHHGIEESYIFPLLARKMPEFRAAGRGGHKGPAAELLQQHRMIHAGMDDFAEYMRQCRNREVELELGVMKSKMDSWGDVLLKHLDQEVHTLRAENMRKYWTVEEMKSMPS